MKFFLLAVMAICFSASVSAQSPEHKKVADKKFILTSVFLAGTTVFDMETSFAAIDKCGGSCKEGNPLLRPLFNSSRPAVYAVQGAVDVGIITWSYKLKKDGNKLWWFPPLVIGTAHAITGGFNLRFVF